MTTHDLPVLEADAITCYRDDRALFSDLSFRLEASQTLLIEGRNGSGKTSLLRILCGIRMPDEGRICWNGKDIFRLGAEYLGGIAYIGHRDGVKLDLTAAENLTIAQNLGNPDHNLSIESALDTLYLSGFDDVPARKMSAGQQRRLALARLLVTRSRLWILDEPFTSLDVAGIALTEQLIQTHVARGGMLVMSSHHVVNLEKQSVIRLNLSE